MERLSFDYPATETVPKRAHVGVVGSGNLEVLIEPSPDGQAHIRVTTSVDGYSAVWKAVLDRFIARHGVKASVEINDFGATPGMVALRLEQAVEATRS
ncbi:malonate decarboxylase subunit delta [Inquilinus limosus]|uniref:malonate decarboxylase subunit delta n=1 Tax=Inquilinus limosus TaxID=171674 RepID=UPI000401FE67|nr:malonate decarboxylase subunit delta [Inquilinus limosus]